MHLLCWLHSAVAINGMRPILYAQARPSSHLFSYAKSGSLAHLDDLLPSLAMYLGLLCEHAPACSPHAFAHVGGSESLRNARICCLVATQKESGAAEAGSRLGIMLPSTLWASAKAKLYSGRTALWHVVRVVFCVCMVPACLDWLPQEGDIKSY